MTTPDDYAIGTIESWIEGPRMGIDPAWFDRQIISLNGQLQDKGWQPIEVVYVKERTTWFTRNFTFKLRGQAYPLRMVNGAFKSLAERMG